MKSVLVVVFFLFIVGCSKEMPSRDEKLADLIMSHVGKDLRKRKGLILCGTGGEMMCEIKMLGMSFNYYMPVGMEQGRELILDAATTLINAVNADEQIRPYLSTYPFTSENIEIRIFLMGADGRDVVSGELSVISCCQGILKYNIDNPKTNLFTAVHRESFEEALRQVSEHHKQAM